MLAPLRRCPASLPRALTAAAANTRFALRGVSIALPRTAASARAVPLFSARSFQTGLHLGQAQAVATAPADTSAAPTITQFQELADRGIVHRNVVEAIVKDMGLTTMTDVQSATINQALQGTDIIAQAKTGTGKTVGFLLPMLQNILTKSPELAEAPRWHNSRGRNPFMRPDIRAIIVSPTRELAEQIAAEARKLTARTGVKVQTAVGGTGKREGMRRIMTEGCHVLVATPGRLNDILYDDFNPIPAENLDYFIYDEADRLLEAGFQREISSIQKKLPAASVRDRQTLMFSATVSQDVVRLVRQTLRPGFHFVKTVRDDEEPTHKRVPQKLVITRGFEAQLPTLFELCRREAELAQRGEKRPFKAIVYLNSLKETQITYSAFSRIRRMQGVKEPLFQGDLLFIHSDLTQGARQKQADTFRAAERAILFSTDVTARGMDFPNVTHVIQMGIPRDPADYVHRIGRTGRAGKEGEGWLIVPQVFEREVHYKLNHLPLNRDTSLKAANVDLDALEASPEDTQEIIKAVKDAFSRMDEAELEDAFPRMLAAAGFVRDKRALIESMKAMAMKLWGLPSSPHVPMNVKKGMGSDGGARGPRGRSGGSDFGRDFGGSSRTPRNPSGPQFGASSGWGSNAEGGFGDGRGSYPPRPSREPRTFGDRSSGPPSKYGNRPQNRWQGRGSTRRRY